MRDARFVGLAADGDALIVEHDGEHLRLPIDARVRKALAGEVQMPMPLGTPVSPREVQHRIRCGESAADIAASAGVAVELIARFEGPVLDELAWHVERARRTVVDGTSLEERVATVTGRREGEPLDVAWDAWLDDDGSWRVAAGLPDGRQPVWAWDPQTRRLRARDDVARIVLSGAAAADDLDAVLRPIAGGRGVVPVPDRTAAGVTEEPTGDESTAAPAAGERSADQPPTEEAPAEEAPAEPSPSRAAGSGGRRSRPSVPSWDDIVFGTTRARPRDEG